MSLPPPRVNLHTRVRPLTLALAAFVASLSIGCTQGAPAPTSPPAPQAAATPAQSVPPQQREQVVMVLSFLPLSYHAPYYIALDKGWYAEQGLDVEVRESRGSSIAIQLVSTGQATFGDIEAGVLVRSIAKGAPIKSLALEFAKSPLGYAYARDADIKTPNDLEGKTFITTPVSAAFVLWPAFAAANGIDTSKVTILNADPGLLFQSVASRRADFTVAAVGEGDYLITQLGRPAGIFLMADYGLNYVGNALVAQTSTIQQSPDMVRRFVGATLRAFDFAKANHQEALDIFLKHNPDTRREFAENLFKESTRFWSSPSGVQTEQQWQATIDLLEEYSQLDDPVKASDVFTNDFLSRR
jgi:NitT/TauT family transport system substrate-binding protein